MSELIDPTKIQNLPSYEIEGRRIGAILPPRGEPLTDEHLAELMRFAQDHGETLKKVAKTRDSQRQTPILH